MKKYETNTILLAIIAIAISIFAISKLYETKMEHDLMYYEPKEVPQIKEAFDKIDKMQDEQLKQIIDQTKENLKTQNEITKTTNQMFKKLNNVPQIQMPQIQTIPKNETIQPTENEEERLKAKEQVKEQMKEQMR